MISEDLNSSQYLGILVFLGHLAAVSEDRAIATLGVWTENSWESYQCNGLVSGDW